MNPVMSLVSIVALLLALGAAGNVAKEQSEVNPSAARQINPSKIVLNHNETMVSDTPLAQMNNAESVRQFQPRVALWQPWESGFHFLKAQL